MKTTGYIHKLTITCALFSLLLNYKNASSNDFRSCDKTIEQYRIVETGAGGHSLENAGTYCLSQDIFVKWNYSWIEGRYQFSSNNVIEINTSDLILNLHGYEIWNDGYLQAVISSGGKEQESKASHLTESVGIRNGSITVRTSGDGIVLVGLGGDHTLDTASDLYDVWISRNGDSKNESARRDSIELAETSMKRRLREPAPRSAEDYPARHITIENLKIKIKGGGRAIVRQGAGTIIRNNVIEVEGGTAIWSAGPNAVIEGNTIIVTGRKNVVSADAAIRLKHGGGAVIRNNRFIIKSGANKRLISVFDSGEFRFENNKVGGLKKDEKIAFAFSGTLKIRDSKGALE